MEEKKEWEDCENLTIKCMLKDCKKCGDYHRKRNVQKIVNKNEIIAMEEGIIDGLHNDIMKFKTINFIVNAKYGKYGEISVNEKILLKHEYYKKGFMLVYLME